MTLDEQLRQRESFAYGNLKVDEPTVTRELVEARARRL
jgi:hypothetical protein